MGTHPIFESDFDCLTDCLFQEITDGDGRHSIRIGKISFSS